MASEIVSAPRGPAVEGLGLSGRGPYVPNSDEGARDVFMHLWTRLDEAFHIVGSLRNWEPGSEGYQQTLAALEQVVDVRLAYQHMNSLLKAKKAAP